MTVYIKFGLLGVKFDFERVTIESDALVVTAVSKGLEKHSASRFLHFALEGRMEQEICQFKLHFPKQMRIGYELDVALFDAKSK